MRTRDRSMLMRNRWLWWHRPIISVLSSSVILERGPSVKNARFLTEGRYITRCRYIHHKGNKGSPLRERARLCLAKRCSSSG